VDVDGGRHTADHVVLANGADPIVPPVPGLRELEGIWTNREITGIWQLTHAGKYRGEVAASNILGEPREANYEAAAPRLHRPAAGRRRRDRRAEGRANVFLRRTKS
jgi:pyruvate/2-oxoglutarate dehydrogenase complex dihydrolipoamide dehydrogenase (E3) component